MKSKKWIGVSMVAFRNTAPLMQAYSMLMLISIIEWKWIYLLHIGIFVLWQVAYFKIVRSAEMKNNTEANPVTMDILDRIKKIEGKLQ